MKKTLCLPLESVRWGLTALLFGLMGCNFPLLSVRSGPTYRTEGAYFFVGAGQSNMSRQNLKPMFPYSANVAVGGSAISQWAPGAPLYNEIVAACQSNRRPCVLLWWQGETEGLSASPYDWRTAFEQIITRLRQDLHAPLPVIMVQIGQTGVVPIPYWKSIQDQQQEVAMEMDHVRLVQSADMFPDTGDEIHYGMDQYAVIQKRMYEQFERL